MSENGAGEETDVSTRDFDDRSRFPENEPSRSGAVESTKGNDATESGSSVRRVSVRNRRDSSFVDADRSEGAEERIEGVFGEGFGELTMLFVETGEEGSKGFCDNVVSWKLLQDSEIAHRKHCVGSSRMNSSRTTSSKRSAES